MGRKSRNYSRVGEAENLIKELCDKHPELFWAVMPDSIAVMGVDNIERSEKAVKKNPAYAVLRTPKGGEKALLRDHNVKVQHVIEIFWSDWNMWRESFKQWIISNLLLQITPDAEKKNRPDCVGFKVLLDVCGVDWAKDDGANLPNMLLSDDIKFNMDLRPALEEEDGEDE